MVGYVPFVVEAIHHSLQPALVSHGCRIGQLLVNQLIKLLGQLQQQLEEQLMKHVELSQDEIKQLIAEKYGVNGQIILSSHNVEYYKKDNPKTKCRTEVYASFWIDE